LLLGERAVQKEVVVNGGLGHARAALRDTARSTSYRTNTKK
jgi:hypothetical protein